ncbi:putative abnormal spindle-like microcephaly-associated protein [Triplophysa rosa]|uniref:Abnormal spindle-like microcephaly-associated protein n=1 Tax=Triplophysa rosa TaxID=992332 RepID=A0A9W7W8J3_TRIRA|nr:putative abnormal spindle-like microcephaly-associated protein [Triplophysa rosa]
MSLKTAKAECLDFSPTFDSQRSRDKSGKENNNSIPVLSLVQFSRSPFVSFGTIKLGSSKSQLLRIVNPTEDVPTTVVVDKISATKGFSVDRTSFTIQPEDSIILNVTWTPVEEGGVRELLCFVANGIVKHQAILLGKAETTKKKKRTLWDSIKSKRGVPAPSIEKKLASVSIKAANKTFHVSRQSQYNKERTSNPLSPLNQERFVNGSSVVRGNAQSSPPCISKPAFVTEVFDDVHLQKNSPVVVLIPADRFVYTPDKKDAACLRKAECKEVMRVLDKTLSPVSTPERFRNPLLSCFQSPLPVIGKLDEGQEQEKPSLSVKHALDVIGSDLSCAVSPPNACSSFDFSDSLESEKQDRDGTFIATVDISPPPEAPHSRLTYCVKPNNTIGVESNHDEVLLKMFPFSTDTVTKLNKVDDTLNPDVLGSKVPVNSTTVTKSKAESSVESPGMRKKTSRRRLLERTLELSEPSNAESNTSSPESISTLPIISSDSSPDVISEKTTACLSLPSERPLFCISPIRSEVLPSVSSSPSTSLDKVPNGEPSHIFPNLFPVQSRTSVQSKKRKSDEFLRDHLEDVSNLNAKNCRAPMRVQGANKLSQEKTFILKSTSGQSQQRKLAATPSSRNFTRPQPKKSITKSTLNCGQSVKSLSTSTRKSAKIVAVAQAKLTFMKPTQTVIPRHPLPFAAKNMFYDERWIEKQERGFTWWMNYVLTPDDFKVATEVTKVNALSLTLGNEKFNIPKAPTKEEMSFRTYTARQRLNRLRRAACKLFTSDAMVKAIQRLELEVEAKRLLVRKDRHLWKDIGERQKVLNWLLSYNPLWLRIGFETIYGELIPLESNSDVVGLAMFILGRLLWNPDIAAEYRHAKVPHLYRDGHEEALSRFSLKKLILLVCFLDKAKESRLIDHDPCLFCMDAEFKSSKDLLLAFARDFLSGEGILSRHLSHLGLAVSHVQTPLDEFNFAVKNLAVDLRCGIRLVRVMELFTVDWTLSRKLRIPAISRLQKVHNVDIALQVLKDKGVDLRDEHGATIDSRDVVDGHREKTLNLLWKIIFVFQVEVMLDENQLKEEISFLRKTWRTKQKLASLIANKGAVVTKMKTRQAFEHPSQKVTLLLDWVNAVCEFYSLKAENFTVSFSDGRVLCYLIHHYHPGHLPAENIQHKTTQTIECGHRGKVELNNSTSDSDCSFDTFPSMQDSPSLDFKELLENERSNFQLVNTAVSYLGGVPAMINPQDMSNTIPNEKVVTCYLSFLCARLLDLRNETRAARVIQNAWRRFKLQKDIDLNRKKNLAAAKIQALVRRFILKRRLIRQNKAAIVIQTSWRGHAACETLRMLKQEKQFAHQNAAATVIQKTYKAWRVRALLRKNNAAFLIQAAFQKWHVKKVTERNNAAIRIQSWYRMQRCKKQYMEIKMKAICFQARLRGHHQRLKFQTLKKRHNASVIIQSAFRAYLVRRQISKMEQNAVLIQRCFRACVLRKEERKRYLKIKSAIITLQAAFCGWKVRRELAQRRQAAVQIQTAFRRFSARKSFRCLKRSVIILQQRYRAKVVGNKLRLEYDALKVASVTIQAAWRGRTVRRKIRHLHRCAEIIQSHYRRYVVQTQFMKLKQAAVVIQRQCRAFREGKKAYGEYIEMKRAAIVLQSAYRGRKARKEIQRQTRAAILIQSSVRGYIYRRAFLAQKISAVVIQQRYRAFALGQSQRVCYLQLRQSTITLQAIYRGSKIRRQLRREQQAATIIQAQFRMHKVRISFLAAKYAAIIIQQRYRAYKTGKSVQDSYSQMKNATVVIQSAFRGLKVRNHLRKSHQAATVIQVHFLGHLQRKKYQKQQWAALVLRERFRATVARNAAVKRYAAMKRAALCIQSAFRGMKVRKQIAECHKSAIIVQKTYKAYKQRRDYVSLRNATLRIQQQYSAILSARQQRNRYCSLRTAAITLQSVYRGMRIRKEIRKRHESATVIQAWLRMYRTRVTFQAMRLAALVIQRQYRCHLLRREARDHFLRLRRSTTTIQAIYRGNRTRCNIATMHHSATIIQRRFLAYKTRKCFLSIRAAVVVCQRYYRSALAARSDRRDYLAKCQAVVKIQAGFRGMQVRRQIHREHAAAMLIQSHVRKRIVKLRFQRLQWAVDTVQRRFRAIKMVWREMALLKEKKNAALILQAAYRGMKSRQTLKRMHEAATVIQTAFRACSARKRYFAMKYAAIAIQQRYRAGNAAKTQRKHFLEMRQGAIALQACFRGRKVRRTLLFQHQAAVLIQSYFRRHKEMVKFQAMRLSANIIQSHYRSHIRTKADRERFLRLRKSAVVIQAAFRGHSVRRWLADMQRASIILQAAFRMHQQRSAFRRQIWAARVLQRRFRALKLRDEQIQRYLQVRIATICLQKSFRAMKERQLVRRTNAARAIQSYLRMSLQRKRFLKEKAAAIVIQSAYKGYRTRVRHTKIQESTVFIQKWYRSCKLVNKERNGFLVVRLATLTLQSALRGMLARRLARRIKAAIKIQSVLLMHVYRRRYVSLRSSVVKMQAHYRMLVAQRRYRRLQAAAVTLQNCYRAQRAKTEQRCSYLRTLHSIKILQARIRGLIEYRRFHRKRTSAITIQAHYRGMLERRKSQRLKQSVCVIQKHYRAFRLCQKERARFHQLRRSAVVIQRAFQDYQTRQHAVKKQAACKIQAWYRGGLARRNYILKRAAITTIQRCIQARRQLSRFQAIQRSVRIIQQRFRETVKARKQRSDFLKFRKSVICIQALWRGVHVRKSIQMQIKAAVKIQSAFRGFTQRREFKRQRAAAAILQRRFRALQLARAERENLRRQHDAAVCLQAACRGWLGRRQLKEIACAARRHRFTAAVFHHLCAIRIQRAVRAHWALISAKRQMSVVLYIQQCFRAKLQRRKYLNDRQDIIKTQRAVRTWLNRRNKAATTIQHAVKQFLLSRRKERLQRGIIKAQALWRGHCSRKLHDTHKVIPIRRRFREVNRNIKEEDKLCNKTTTALSYLLGYQNYAYILAALKHLETATRLSPECCERLVESGATRTIFILMRSCNRSVPSMEIITLSIQVLLNLSKYHRTIDAVYDVENSVETLLDLLQIYREKAGDKVADKGGSIFTKACFLLVLLVQDERRAMEVRKLPKASDRIRSICRLTLRKCKMDTERTKVKQKMNASLNGSFLLQATPRKSKPVAKFVPDWVLRRDKMKDIVDPLRAIQMLANALALVP